MTTATDNEIDTDILEALDFEPVPPSCDYTDCEEKAASKLLCGVCAEGCEFMCGPHTVVTALAQQQAPDERIKFDQTCGHDPFFETCKILPL